MLNYFHLERVAGAFLIFPHLPWHPAPGSLEEIEELPWNAYLRIKKSHDFNFKAID